MIYSTFAKLYYSLIHDIGMYPTSLAPRREKLACEMIGVHLHFEVPYISVYSNKDTRAFPITFALAEFLWILSGSMLVSDIIKFNKSMSKYSEDGLTIPSSYGIRLHNKLDYIIDALKEDKYTRQACANIWNSIDSDDLSVHKPCNTFLQFIYRDNRLNLIVTSRSSDFITGLPIDAFHWQMLLHVIANQLNMLTGYITYNIGSLHVYEQDKEMLHNIINNNHQYEHNILMNKTFSELRRRAYSDFSLCKTLEDLVDVYGFDDKNMTKIAQIYDIFLNRKWKIQR